MFNGVGINGILKLLEGKPRKAKFVTAFAYATPNLHPVAFVGECEGNIAEKPSEVIDFAYDTIFVPKGETRTFSEMTKEEKERYSHRAKVLWKSLSSGIRLDRKISKRTALPIKPIQPYSRSLLLKL